MPKTTETFRHDFWLDAIAEVAREQGVNFPPFTGHAMGSARSETDGNGRFVTFKRRLVPAGQAEVDGVEWTLWQQRDDSPIPIAAFREPLIPHRQNVIEALTLLHGWLAGAWTQNQAQDAVGRHPGARDVGFLPTPSRVEMGE